MAGPIIHAYRAAEPGLCVNSYLVEAESGVVVVDTNLLVSDIEALHARLRVLKKQLLAILVTHPHPDHFNGVAALAGVGTLYPGHGDPGPPGVFAEQRRYLLYYREVIQRLSGGEPRLSEAAKAELNVAMEAFLPAAPLAWMIGLGADAVAGELAAAGAPAVTR